MKKKKKIIILSILVVLVVGWIAFCGYLWAWGPFHKLHDIKTGSLPGNASEYALENVHEKADSPLQGKNIVFLGSSVTYGASSKGVSFADDITKQNGNTMIKEAVSGTTLVDEGINSYISRMKKSTKMQRWIYLYASCRQMMQRRKRHWVRLQITQTWIPLIRIP